MGAVVHEAVDMVGNWFECGGVSRLLQVGKSLGSKSGGDVELLLSGGHKKEMNDGVEFVAADLAVGVHELHGGWSRVGGAGGDLDGFAIGLVGGELKGGG